MASAGTVNVNLVAKTAAFMADIGRAQMSIRGLTDSVFSVRNALMGLAGAWAVNEVREFVQRSFEGIDAQVKLADRIGVSTQMLGGLAYAAKLSGVESQALGASMTKLADKVGDAMGGSKSAREDIEKLGMDFRKLALLAPDEQFLAVADSIKAMGTAAERTAAATSIFGKSGAELIPVFLEGSDAIRAQAKEAEALGVALNRVDAEKVVMANDAMTASAAAIEGAANTFAVALAPTIQSVAEHFTKAAKNSNGFRDTMIAGAEWIVKAIGKIADVWQVLQMAFYAGKAAILTVFAGVQWAVHGLIVQFMLAKEYGDGLWRILKAGAGMAAAGMSVAWASVKYAFASMIATLGDLWAGFQRRIADAVSYISDDTAASMRAAADRVTAGVAAMRDSAAAGVAESADAARASVTEMANAARAMLDIDVMKSGIVLSSRAAISQTMDSAEQAAVDFKAVMNAPWKSDEMDAWFKNLRTNIDKAASEKAGSVDERLAADAAGRIAAVEKVNAQATAEFKQGWSDAAAWVQGEALKAAEASSAYFSQVGTAITLRNQRKEQMLSEFGEVRAVMNLEQLAEIERYNQKLENLKQYREEKLLTEAEYDLMEQEVRAQHEANLANIGESSAQRRRKFERKTDEEKLQMASQVFGNLSSLMNTHSRRMFAIGKAAAYANTIVNTAQAIMKAWADIGPIGAAAAAAAGAVQLAAISGQTFDGGGGSVSVGSGAAVDAFAKDSAKDAARGPVGVVAPRQIDLNLGDDDVVLVGKAGVRRFIDKINEAIGDGVQLRVA